MIEQVQQVFKNRLDNLGVSGAVIQSNTADGITVFLPGTIESQQAERVLGTMGQLDIRKQKPGTETQLRIEQQIRQKLLATRDKIRNSGYSDGFAENQAALKRSNSAIAALFEPIGLTGKYLKDAFAEPSESDKWNINIRFDSTGAELFTQLTKDMAGTGRAIGIFVDKELLSAPTVGPEFAEKGITGGKAVITGSFTAQQAYDLAIQFRAGALPAPVEIVSNHTVKVNSCQKP